MKKRIRKKKHVGEFDFSEFCVALLCDFDPEILEKDRTTKNFWLFDHYFDELSEQLLRNHDLHIVEASSPEHYKCAIFSIHRCCLPSGRKPKNAWYSAHRRNHKDTTEGDRHLLANLVSSLPFVRGYLISERWYNDKYPWWRDYVACDQLGWTGDNVLQGGEKFPDTLHPIYANAFRTGLLWTLKYDGPFPTDKQEGQTELQWQGMKDGFEERERRGWSK